LAMLVSSGIFRWRDVSMPALRKATRRAPRPRQSLEQVDGGRTALAHSPPLHRAPPSQAAEVTVDCCSTTMPRGLHPA
jgi:hypothetical protein